MISIVDIEAKLVQKEAGKFQIICNEILKNEGYNTFDRTGSELGTEKTILGTPDSTFIKNGYYIYVEFSTVKKRDLLKKIKKDIDKCLKKIHTDKLKGKVSEIIFMHNRKQPELKDIEEIKEICKKEKIEFIIYGIDTISDLIQRKYQYIAEQHLELRDYNNLRTSMPIENKKISDRVNILYEEASKIINTHLSLIYINNEEREQLYAIYKELLSLEYIYRERGDDERKIYYNNLLVILQRYDRNQYIEKFKEFEKQNLLGNEEYYLYIKSLILENKAEEALSLIEKFNFIYEEKDLFIYKIKCYFRLGKYETVIEELNSLDIEEYDDTGHLATFFVLSKNYIERLKLSEILELNEKFKNMPLYYMHTSKIMFDFKYKGYKKQFMRAIKYTPNDDYTMIGILSDISKEINQTEKMIKYLMKIKNENEFIKIKLAELLINKKDLTNEELKKLEEIVNALKKENIDINYLYGVINQNKGYILKAIENYKMSYSLKSNKRALYNYIKICIETNNKLDENIFPKITDIQDYKEAFILVDAYKHTRNIKKAFELSYFSLYLLGNRIEKEVYKQFYMLILEENQNLFSVKENEIRDSVIILENLSNNIIEKYIVEDKSYFKEGKNIADLKIIKLNNNIVLNLLGKKKEEFVEIGNIKYKIVDIIEKYDYLYKYAFNIIKKEENIFISTGDINKSLEELNKIVYEDSKKKQSIIDEYQKDGKITLACLSKKDYLFEKYIEIMEYLLLSEQILWAGETIEVNLEEGFVLDITTLITLIIINKIDVLTDDICKKVYISKTLKNEFDYYFENIMLKYNEKEITIGYSEKANNSHNLVLSEKENKNKIKILTSLNEYIKKFNVVDIEFQFDEIVNKDTKSFFDKVQLDLVQISIEKNIPFICDEMFIRRLCNQYKVVNTNTNFLINHNINDYSIFMNNLIELAKHNYIFAFYEYEFGKIIKYLIKDFNKENKELFKKLIMQLVDNEKSKNVYKPKLIGIMEHYEKFINLENFDDGIELKIINYIYNVIKEVLNNK